MRKTLALLVLAILLLTSCTTLVEGKRAEQAAEQASLLFAQKEYAASQKLYAEAVSLAPDIPAYQYNEQLSRLYLKEYEKVVEMSEASFAQFPAHLSFLFLKARALSQMEAYDQALSVYAHIFSLNPALYAERMEVAENALQWGYPEQTKALALALVAENQMEKQAFSLLASLEGEESWYAHVLAFLTKGGEEPSQEQLQRESNTGDGPSSDEEPAQPVSDTPPSP